MTMHPDSSPIGSRGSGALRSPLLRGLLAGLLGVLAALLISCSGSAGSLIPTGDAGPLRDDFRAVARAAENGDGSCAATESALLKTEQHFAALPASIDSGLHDRLREGIENLRTRALALCTQPLPQSTSETSAPRTTTSTTTATTPTVTQTTSTQTTPTEPPAPSGPGGGTPAPGSEGTPGAGGESGGGAGGGEVGENKLGGGQEAGK